MTLRIQNLCIDCRTDHLGDALAFWTGALGIDGQLIEDGAYAEFDDRDRPVRVLMQAVKHDPRVHLDLETENAEAERERLEGLGARTVGRVKDWIVMEAPTGHRFCLVPPEEAP